MNTYSKITLYTQLSRTNTFAMNFLLDPSQFLALLCKIICYFIMSLPLAFKNQKQKREKRRRLQKKRLSDTDSISHEQVQ